MKHLSRLLLRILGWKLNTDAFPYDLKKYVVAVAPHTSWKDFLLGLVVRNALGRNIHYIGKKELFDGPFGFFFWWTGGRPVDRSNRAGVVDQVTKLFAGSEEFAIALAPEGTREKVSDLKTGFYHMAKTAQVPIVPCLFDYGNKTVTFLAPMYTTSDREKDLDAIWALFRGVQGAKPGRGIEGERMKAEPGPASVSQE
jgi:1-acyl-sn-glycerol-3-phosphate acyltransferase